MDGDMVSWASNHLTIDEFSYAKRRAEYDLESERNLNDVVRFRAIEDEPLSDLYNMSMRDDFLSSSVPLQSRSHGFVPARGRFTSHTIAIERDAGRLAQNQVGHGFGGSR